MKRGRAIASNDQDPFIGNVEDSNGRREALVFCCFVYSPCRQLKVEVIMKEGGVNPVVSFEGKWNKENAYLRTLPMVF